MGAPLGNQNAVKGKRWTHAIERAIERRFGGAEKLGEIAVNRGLDVAADKLVALMESKNETVAIATFREVGDRIEGKVVQPIQHGGPDGGLIPIDITNRNETARRIAWTLMNAVLNRAADDTRPAIPGIAQSVNEEQES